MIFRTTRELFDLFDVSYVDAPQEAEPKCAHMARGRRGRLHRLGGLRHLLFRAPLTLRKLTSQVEPEVMDLEATLDEHGITREQLVAVAILCGTDYNDGLYGYGPKTALGAVKEHGKLDMVLEDEDEHDDESDRIRSFYLDPAVTDDYEFDRVVEPDLEGISRYVTDTWEVPKGTIDRAIGRLEANTPLAL